MKKNTGGWVVPFKFTNEQRKMLIISGWKTPANHAKAEYFINATQITISQWLAVNNEGHSIAEDRRQSASQIQKAAQELSRALNDSPADVNETIAAELDERLVLTRDYPEHIDADRYLRRATGNEFPGLYQMADILECWLCLLSESARAVADIKDAPGQNKGREKWLINNLAGNYETYFNKPPSSENNSCFRNFCSALSEIIKHELGKKIIEEVLEQRAKTVPFHSK